MASLAVVPLGQAVLDGLSRKAKVLLKELGRETQRRMHSAGLPATGLGDRTIITTSASSHLRSSPDIITIRPATSTFSQLLASPGIFPSQTFTPEPLSPGGMVTGERRDRNSRAMSTSTSRRTLTAAGPEAQSGSGPLGGASHGSLGSNATVNGVSVVALPPHLRAAAAAQRPGTAPGKHMKVVLDGGVQSRKQKGLTYFRLLHSPQRSLCIADLFFFFFGFAPWNN